MDRFAALFATHLLCAEVEAEVAGSLGVPVLLHGAVWLRGPQLMRSAQWWLESGVLVLTRVVLFTTSCVVNSPELCSQQVVLYTLVAVSPVTSHRLPCTATAWSTEKTRHQLPASCLPVSISSIYTQYLHTVDIYLHTRYLDRVVVTPLLCPPVLYWLVVTVAVHNTG